MSLFHCRFCDHANPAGARFCNECGSPLYLKPCPQCEAVNDGAASQCFQCGAALPKDDATPEPSVAAMPEFANATANCGDVGGAEHRNAPGAFTERFEIEFGEFRPSLFSDKPIVATTPGGATSDAAISADLRETRMSPGAAHHGSVTRSALTSTGALLVLALIVVGAAAYYMYEHSAALTKSAGVVAASPPSAQQQSAAGAKATPAAPNDAVTSPVATTPPEP